MATAQGSKFANSGRTEFDVDRAAETALNRVCPYFTMFPLRFPYGILRRRAEPDQAVLDPFCGRGTTNYAARLLGLDTTGVDSSPIAGAIAEAKLIQVTAEAVSGTLDQILEAVPRPSSKPEGEFWRRAYAPATLDILSRAREALVIDCSTPSRKALRAIMLGALHGPRAIVHQAYFSNQAPRTYAPKPAYAVKFWKERRLNPPAVDVAKIVRVRADRFYGSEKTRSGGRIVVADSRTVTALELGGGRFDWIITSPPYYGMRTYIPDQWLRNWFLGGPSRTDYSSEGQLDHQNPEAFAVDLRRVWRRAACVAAPEARLVIRFGGINDRRADPLEILKCSIADSGWTIATVRNAGSAATGRRQAVHFRAGAARARDEYDVWAVRSR